MNKTWKARAIEALQASIEHWQRMKDNPLTCGERPSITHCACCNEFMSFTSEDICFDCPIALYAGDNRCKQTPYDEAADAFHKRLFVDQHGSKSFISKMNKEISFLIEVLTWVKKGAVKRRNKAK